MADFACGRSDRTLSVAAANRRGVAALVADVERGNDVIIQRDGHPVAAVVSMDHVDEFRRLRADLTTAALVLARELTASAGGTELNDAIAAFGFDRQELEDELDVDLAAGRE